jgi:ClpP class serine protease
MWVATRQKKPVQPPCNRVLAAIARQPWAITPDGLELVLAIAARETSDPTLAAALRAQYATADAFDPDCDGDDDAPSIAVIPIHGTIMPRADLFAQISGATSVEAIGCRVNAALERPGIKGIVLDIDSPGGHVTGINELANLIYDARAQVPIVAYVSGMCCSAAYWLGSAASTIIVDETSVLGSIGCCAAWTDDSAQKEMLGLKDFTIVSSQTPNKMLDPATAEGARDLQKQVDAIADIFIGSVARNRGKQARIVQERFGQGGTMLGSEAIDVDMADDFGSLQSVVDSLLTTGKLQLTSYGDATMAQNRSGRIRAQNPHPNLPPAEEVVPTDPDEELGEVLDEDPEEEETGTDPRQPNPTPPADMSKKAGVLQERARIKAIEDLGIVGHDDLVAAAKFAKPVSAATLALQVLTAEKESRATAADGYRRDAEKVAGVPASGAATSTAATDEAALIEAMAAGMVSAGSKRLSVVKGGK